MPALLNPHTYHSYYREFLLAEMFRIAVARRKGDADLVAFYCEGAAQILDALGGMAGEW